MKKTVEYLGILATPLKTNPPFPEKPFYAYLSQAGKKIGISVYVFLPNQVDYDTQTVTGYQYINKQWKKGKFPFPNFVYDRCSNRKVYGKYIKKIKTIPSITFLGHVLPGKWENHQKIIQHEDLVPYIPNTELITSMRVVNKWLDEYEAVIIKPVQNSLGIGVMKLSSGETHSAEGRDLKNRIFHRSFPSRGALLRWLRETLKGKFLIQPYLELSTPEGIPFDIRVLVQKDASGRWTETARAVRAGVSGGLTSNLCGGGKAYSARPFLEQYFTQEQLEIIEEDIDLLVNEIPPFIESKHGRLVELGIDIGVDKNGQVWLIEINSKPGRRSFRLIDNGTYFKNARLNPLKYTYYLTKRHSGRED
ncbi:YheC/YheD family protein [Aneurinibacillus terranovensis]|uniref:YheC/YheD family endospore coat-associated protein n=1 Tax=Aneurinibacillus terranovensis TaxID=278991 RepID=UPI0004255DD0|nr:YheC/YheD family protein [Aneurinibacillus terranovensis]